MLFCFRSCTYPPLVVYVRLYICFVDDLDDVQLPAAAVAAGDQPADAAAAGADDNAGDATAKDQVW